MINIVFDPIFYLCPGYGGRRRSGSHCYGQIVAAILAIYLNGKKNHEIQLSFRGFRPSGAIIGVIYAVGVPSIIMAAISSVMTFGMNQILIGFTTTATAVLGVYFKLQSFIFMPVFGLNNGLVPIIAYNLAPGSRTGCSER